MYLSDLRPKEKEQIARHWDRKTGVVAKCTPCHSKPLSKICPWVPPFSDAWGKLKPQISSDSAAVNKQRPVPHSLQFGRGLWRCRFHNGNEENAHFGRNNRFDSQRFQVQLVPADWENKEWQTESSSASTRGSSQMNWTLASVQYHPVRLLLALLPSKLASVQYYLVRLLRS